MVNKIQNFNYFWHQEDDYTLTSEGYVWVYPGKPLIKKDLTINGLKKVILKLKI